ncbi:MAG: hypothetical protein ACJ8JD_06220, partial [Chthoniobacterales bacterium]
MATSLLEPQPPSLARQHYRSRIAARRKAIKLLRLAAFVLVVVFAAVGFYIGKRGFGRHWRQRLSDELLKRGVAADIRRLTLDPFRGLIAQDVRLYDSRDRDNLLAAISEIAVDINYAALLHHQPFINALDVRDARVTIPLGQSPGLPDRARVTNVSAHVLFPPDQIQVTEAQGFFAGVRISAIGQLIKLTDYKSGPEASEDELRKRMQVLQRVTAELSKCSFPVTPVLQINFSADLSKPEQARASAQLRADNMQRGDYQITGLRVAAEWDDQKLNVTQCEWADAAGKFAARATWNAAAHSADFQARSSLNLRSFVDAAGFGQFVSDLTFNSPPLLDLGGSVDFRGDPPRVSVIGRIAADNVSYKKVDFASVTSDFAWDGNRTMLRELRIRHATGAIAADLLDAPGDFRLNIDSTISPAALQPMLPGEAGRFLGEWDFQTMPRVRMSLRGSAHDPQTWTGDGNVELGRTNFRHVPLKNATAKLRFADRAINFDSFRVARDEGVATGSCAYDFGKHEVRLANVKTTLRPTDAIIWIEPKLFKEVAPYKFHQIPNVTANGVIQFHGGTADHLEIVVDAPSGMDYVFLGKTLPIDKVGARLLFTNDRLQIFDLAGTLFGGALRGGADISLAKGDPHYHANVALDGVDFPTVTDLYFKYKSAHGRLAGSFDWNGFSD